jgi:hypothetical protein
MQCTLLTYFQMKTKNTGTSLAAKIISQTQNILRLALSPNFKMGPTLLCFCIVWLLGCQRVVEYRQDSARTRFLDGKSAIELAYRQSLSSLIKSATRGELFLLDFQTQGEKRTELAEALFPDPTLFPIRPYEVATRVLASHTLSETELTQVLAILPATIADENREGAFCHYPIHGIRLYRGDEMLFETSFCYFCHNFYVSLPDGQASWVGLEGDQLQTLLTSLMPIPESESKRFHRLHVSRPSKHKEN